MRNIFRSFFRYRKLSLALFLVVTFTILVATLFPSNKLSEIRIWDYDKVGHFLMFFAWTFLYGIVRAIRIGASPNLISVFLLGLFYGILIELLQFILPTNRSPELYDFIADALGSLAAIFLLRSLFRSVFSGDE